MTNKSQFTRTVKKRRHVPLLLSFYEKEDFSVSKLIPFGADGWYNKVTDFGNTDF